MVDGLEYLTYDNDRSPRPTSESGNFIPTPRTRLVRCLLDFLFDCLIIDLQKGKTITPPFFAFFEMQKLLCLL